MPFHVEISSPLGRSRVLNLDDDAVRARVLEPWVAGLCFHFGDRDWEPRESRLTILEGPAVESAELDAEARWAGALRAAEDMTRPMLEAAEASAPMQTAVVVEADSVDSALKGLRSGRPPMQIPWSTAVDRIHSRDPEVTAIVLVVRRSGPARPHAERQLANPDG
jgi:hypothetical protein